MRNIRTDLASERCGIYKTKNKDVKILSKAIGNVRIEETVILHDASAKRLKLAVGRYITVAFDDPALKSDREDILRAITDSLSGLFGTVPENILVAGLGNREVTPDSLGFEVCRRTVATRHLVNTPLFSVVNSKGCRVSVITADVLSKTGIDSADTVKAISDRIKPDSVIIIDALAALNPDRLCTTVQLNDYGIIPASGYGGDRPKIDKDLLGVPVIGIGVPTVVDSRAYKTDFTSAADGLVLTPVSIGEQILKCAEIVAAAINRFFGTEFDKY